MKTPCCFSHVRFSFIVILFLLSGACIVRAGTDIWTGTGADAKWKTAGNWLGGSAPLPGDALIFTNAVGLNNTNDFLAGTSFSGLTFETPAGAFVLNGNSISLSGNITDKQVVTEQTIGLPLGLATTPTVNVVANGLLTISGVVSGSGGLTKVGGGQLNLNGANTFMGALTVDAGKVAVGSDGNLGAAPGSPTVGSIVLNGGALDATASFTLNANRGIAVGSGSGGFGVLTVDSGHTLTYGGVIANNGGVGTFTKNGYGGLTLSGQNSYTGATSNRVGALTLDFSQAGAPANNIIAPGSDLTLGGENAGAGLENEAQLNIVGAASAVNSQTFHSTHLTFAQSIVQVTSGSGGTANLNLGALSHDAGGTLMFLPAQLGGGAGAITTTSGNVNGILGGYATIGDGTYYSSHSARNYYSTNFAAVDGSGNIIGFDNYFTWASGNLAGQVTIASNLLFQPSGPQVITVDNANAGTLTEVNAINISTPDSGTTANYYGIYIGAGNTLRLGQFGGLLKTDRSEDVITIGGADGSVQSGSGASGSQDVGTLTAGGADNQPGEIVIASDGYDNSHGAIIFESTITDNGTGPVTFVKTGPGPIKLDGHNTFSGGLYLLQGRVQFAGTEIGTGNPDGGGSGPIYILPGAYLFPSGTGGATITNDIYVAGNGDAAEPLGAIRGGAYSGTIHLIGDANLSSGAAFDGPITGPYDLGIGVLNSSAHGGIHLNNPANDWTGDTLFIADVHSATKINDSYCGANDVIPHGFGKGNVIFESSSVPQNLMTFDLSGFNQTINGLSTTGSNPQSAIIQNTTASTTSTLTVGDNNQSGTFAGELQDGGGTLAVIKIGGGVETLSSSNSYSGDTTVSGGTLALSGAGSIANSAHILVQTSGTLDVSAETGFNTPNPLTLSAGGQFSVGSGVTLGTLNATNGRVRVPVVSGTAAITTSTLNLGGATNYIDLASVGLISGYPVEFPVIRYSGTIGGTFNFGLGSVPSSTTTGYVTNNTANGTVDVVLLSGPEPLTWTAANGNDWDIGTSVNWLAFGTTPSTYGELDSVVFDDTAASGTVNLTTAVQPSVVEVTNNNLTYTFTGPGAIAGVGSMAKDGTGTLVVDNSGANTFVGGFTIANGTVQVGNNDTNGSLPVVGGIENNSSLVFDRTDDFQVSGDISGSGSLTKNYGGALTLSGNNTFTGAVSVVLGTLKAGSDSALGSADGATTIDGGATLDVNGHMLNTEPVIVSGDGVGGLGAIINSGADNTHALGDVTLTGNTTFGGTGRWDIRGGVATLSTSGNGYNITKIGTNQVSLVGVTVDGALGDINVMSGTFSVETTTTGLGNPGSTLTVASGATLQLYGTTAALSKQFNLTGDSVATTVNCANGTGNNLNGTVTLNGACIFNATSGSTLTFSSATVTGSGSFQKIGPGTNILSAGATANYTGNTTVSNGVFEVNGSLSGNVSVTASAAFGGAGSVGGSVSIDAGTLLPGNVVLNQPGTLSVGSLAMNNGTSVFRLSNSTSSGNDQVSVAGALSFSGMNTLHIAPLSFMNVGDTYTLFTYGGATLPSSVTNNLQITTSAGFAFSIVDPATTPGSIQIHVVQAIGNILWTGQTSSTWNTSDTNWNRGGNAVAFNNGDYVNFDDSSSVTGVSLSGALQVGNITMNNSVEAYQFGGTGSLSGSGGLTLAGGGGLTIANAGSNSFTGPITISAGTLQLGDGGTNGNLGSGVITNNGSLTFDRSDSSLVVNNSITGNGGVVNNGPGEATLGGANTFDGEVDVLQGTLGVASSSALGDTFGETVVSDGASLDIANTANVSAEVITVSGSGVGGKGAIVNNSGNPNFVGPNIGNIYMAGDLTVGGSGRLDFRASSDTAEDVLLLSFGAPYTLTKVGTNQFQMAGVQIDPSLGNIDVQGGTIGFQWQMPSLGNPTYSVHLHPNTTMNLFDVSNVLNKVLIMDAGSSIYNQHGDNTFGGPVTLTGAATFNTPHMLTLSGAVDGAGSLIKIGGSSLVLSTGPESYSGNTYVNGGTLALVDVATLSNTPSIVLSNSPTIDVSGRLDGTLSLGDTIGQTLAGGGIINGMLTENAGSVVNPGNGWTTATLTVSNAVTLNGQVILDLNRTNALTADELMAPAITAGGTLLVTNLGPDLVTGDRFQLFSVPVSGFTSVQLPTQNATGTIPYTWTNNIGTDGSITLLSGASLVSPVPTNLVATLSGGNLKLTWPADHTGWTLQAQTNAVSVGLGTNWVNVPGSMSTNEMIIPISTANGTVFYRLVYTP